MTQRILSYTLIFLLLITLISPSALGEESVPAARMTSGFLQGDQIYLFTDAPLDDKQSPLQAEFHFSHIEETFPTAPFSLASRKQWPSRFVILTDGWMGDKILDMLQALTVCTNGSESLYGLGAIGQAPEEYTDSASFLMAAEQMAFESPDSVADSLLRSIRELELSTRRPGELIHLILLWSGDPGPEDTPEKLTALEDQLLSETGILLHTCTPKPQSTLPTLGRGFRITVDKDDPKDAVLDLLENINSLWGIQRLLESEEVIDLQQLSTGSLLIQQEGREIYRMEFQNLPFVGSSVLPLPLPDQLETVPAPTQAPETVPAPTQAPEAVPEEPSSTPSQPPSESVSVPSCSLAESESSPDEVIISKKVLILAGCGIALFLLALTVVLVLFLTKKKTRRSPTSGHGILMEMEVISGTCTSRDHSFRLDGELIAGSNPECSISFSDSGVAPRHCRIYLQGTFVFIQDLDTRDGTALGGMRLHGPNRLRSGDEISIGSAVFRLLF